MMFSWQGKSGDWYPFDVARTKRAWEPVGGIYMFVKSGDLPTMEAGGPIVLYIGQTTSLAESLARHDLWPRAAELGADEVHVLPISDVAKRTMIHADITRAQSPLLNRGGGPPPRTPPIPAQAMR